jgi:D-inositol-3-phosphate glycosyltransferase
MRILFVLENYLPHIGGVEVVFKELMEGLAKRGHRVDVVTHRMQNTKVHELVNGVYVHRVECFRSRYWFSLLAIPRVLQLARKADVIHTTTYNGAVPAKIASLLKKKPCIITIHEVLGKNWKKLNMSTTSALLHQFFEHIIIHLGFTKYVNVSHSTAKCLQNAGVSRRKSTVVHNAVDYSFWDPKKYHGRKIRKQLKLEKNFVLLFFGRPGISKGLPYLIKAMPAIIKNIKQVKLLAIVSKDPAYKEQYSQIQNMIQRLELQDKVFLHNPVPRKDLPNYLKAGDCVVVPSITEGFGFTAAESCAMGKPVVASNTTSIPEVISGKYVLVKPRSPEALGEGVRMVYKKQYAQTKLKKFTRLSFLNGYLHVYETLGVRTTPSRVYKKVNDVPLVKKSKKIALLTPTYSPFSGIDRVVELQAEELTNAGKEVTIVALEGDLKKHKSFNVIFLGFPLQNETFKRIYRLFFFLHRGKINKAARALRDHDLVISHLYPMHEIAKRARQKHAVQYVYHNHGVASPKLFKSFVERKYMQWFNSITNKSLKGVDGVVSISDYLRRVLKKEAKIESDIVYDPIDRKRFNKNVKPRNVLKKYGVTKKDKVILYVGRISPHKGIHHLIRAFNVVSEKSTINARNARVKLVIAGKPTFDDYFKQLKKIAGKNKNPKNIIFTGFVEDEDLPSMYASCDVYATASLWEGFNMTVVEAQACGKPVVAFDMGPHKEVIKLKAGKGKGEKEKRKKEKGKEVGILVPTGDVQAFSDALTQFL